MLLINSILHVIEFSLVSLKKSFSILIRSQIDCLVQLFEEWAFDVLNNTIGGAFLSLFGFFLEDFFDDILFVDFHVDLRVIVPIDHPFLIAVLITSLGEMFGGPLAEGGGLGDGP